MNCNRARTPIPDPIPDHQYVAINVRGIPFQHRNAFKALCSRKGASMNTEFLRFIQLSVEDDQLLTDTSYAQRIENEIESL